IGLEAISEPDEKGMRTVMCIMNGQLRPVAERHLARLRHTPALARYFKRRRLTALALPGGVPERLAFVPRNRAVRGLALGIAAGRGRAQVALAEVGVLGAGGRP
ncbi:hypothetical protein ADL35_26335, partial [Streptomyces sp. NRRL WC-3753]